MKPTIKVKGQWRYLDRAVDKHGQTIDFLLTEQRDKEAALRFLKKAIRRNGLPETITIDGSDANEAAIKSYNEEHGTHIIIRQVKYLNNIVSCEQIHTAGCRSKVPADPLYPHRPLVNVRVERHKLPRSTPSLDGGFCLS